MKKVSVLPEIEEIEDVRTPLSVLKTHCYATTLTSKTEANVLLWCLRALGFCKKTNSLYRLFDDRGPRRDGFEGLLAACAPLKLRGDVTEVMDLVEALPELIQQLAAMQLTPSATERSISSLSCNCIITETEQSLLLFGITIHENELLERVMDRCFRKVSSGLLFSVLSHVLDKPVEEFQAALRSDSFLNRAGLLRLDGRSMVGFDNQIDIGIGVAEAFEIANGDWKAIVSKVCTPVYPSSLIAKDFGHMEEEWRLVLGYLEGCAREQRIGANVLLYGAPGCGKTEFARALLAASSLRGYELVSQNLSGRSFGPERRRSCYRQASEYLKSDNPGVIIVDEMDGMLNFDQSPHSELMGGSGISKASANAQLESNPVPTIWITNDPRQLDSAQLRRFDLVIGFSRPSRPVIKEMLETRLQGKGLSREWIEAASEERKLTPGLVGTLANVAHCVNSGGESPNGTELLLNTVLKQRGICIKRPKKNQYRIEYCNASLQHELLVNTLTLKEDARCLLYGTTGTGKTAFAKFVAAELSLQPRLVRPSDILDPYVGKTEQNIAELFGSSDPEESLIILDEFESFAVNRKETQHNWQVSQVNELLGQLEDYEGRVIACTNLSDYIDPAIRRRFQLKVELLPLTDSQRNNLFREYCKKLGLIDGRGFRPSRWIGGLEGLAYGHFANAAEVALYQFEMTLEDFVYLLEQELRATNGRVSRPIGFVN